MTKRPQERRQYPRIEAEIPVSILANGYDLATNTQNLSCVGAYCHIDKYIPPFTKVMVKMALPKQSQDKTQDKNHVECKGVVVRTEDEKNGGFNIAIFFNEIKDSQRKKISQHLHKFLPK